MKNEVVEMILFIFISFNTANIVKCRAFVNRKRRFISLQLQLHRFASIPILRCVAFLLISQLK